MNKETILLQLGQPQHGRISHFWRLLHFNGASAYASPERADSALFKAFISSARACAVGPSAQICRILLLEVRPFCQGQPTPGFTFDFLVLVMPNLNAVQMLEK